MVNDVPVEFGDLPDLYGTTLGKSGAYHFVLPDFFLGASADGEGNGNPSPDADGDDTCPPSGLGGQDDEDGVRLPARLDPGGESCVEVYLTDTRDPRRGGVLDAWMDFDANGWDSGDRIITAHKLTKATWNTICFPVPQRGGTGRTGSGRDHDLQPFPPERGHRATGCYDGADSHQWRRRSHGTGWQRRGGGLSDEAPTVATAVSFTASQAGRSVLVEWETASEIDNLGFNLYRAESEDGVRIKLNEALIPSQMPPGSPVGAAYEFVDEAIELGVVYDYWLEAVDIHGQAETYGPVSAGLLTMVIDPGLWRLSPMTRLRPANRG